MKPSSAKNKGRLLQQWVRDQILSRFKSLDKDDVRSTSMGAGGEDIQLSPAVRKKLPISIEVKRRKAALKTVYDFLDQAAHHGKGEPVVFFRADRKPWVVMIDIEHYIELIKVWGEKNGS